MDSKYLVEAALFLAGRSMTPAEVGRAVSLTPAKARDALTLLMQEYRLRDSALEVVAEDGKYTLRVRDSYLPQVQKLTNITDLSEGETKTLSVIAFYQPITQAEIIKIRGNSAYDQLRNLLSQGLITATPKGRTKLLATTAKFTEYFGPVNQELKALALQRGEKVPIEKVEQEETQPTEEPEEGAAPSCEEAAPRS